MHHRRCGLQAVGAVLGLGLSVCTPTHARPQTAPRPPGDVTEVVVRASPGPALWRVTKGRSELVILGAISPTPAGGSWNTRPLADALRGARVLMLSPGSTPGFAWAEAFPQSRRYLLQQPFGRTLRGELDPDAATRFARMAAAVRQPLSRYGDYRPGPAGMILLEDSWSARGLTGSRLDDTVVSLAQAAHVRVVKVDEGGALPLIDAMPAMSKVQHAACAAEAMDQFDREGAGLEPAFRAWASGDLPAL